jgi:predicted nucleotidyltransferase
MPTKEDVHDFGPGSDDVRLIISRIAKAVSPSAILLFGSRARGEASAESDVDILVVWRDEEPPVFRSAAVRRAIGHQPLPLDIAVVTPSEFERFRVRPAHIVGVASREGVVVHAA